MLNLLISRLKMNVLFDVEHPIRLQSGFNIKERDPFFISCLLYTNPHPGICDVCQSALGGLFPSGSFLPPRQRFFELFPH
ncbi:hypothetical protein ACVWDS_18600, partial [Escherichia coli]